MFWTEGRNLNFLGLEEHMNYSFALIVCENGVPEEIAAGIHTFRFICQIPENVPPTVVRQKGWNEFITAFIQYKVKVRLDIPMKRKIVEKREFIVNREQDLNLIQNIDKVCDHQETMQLTNLCCKTNFVQIKIKIPKVGFARKEKIPFTIQVFGVDGKFPVKNVQIQLLRLRICRSQTPIAKVMTDIQTDVNALIPIVVESDFFLIESSIEVPEICPISNVRYGNLYHITYVLDFIFLSDGCEKSAIISVPISIGTIPIQSK